MATRLAPDRLRPQILGPFGFQPGNCETRRFEYPWAYHATSLRPGLRVVEIGGSLSGLQFVLSKAGVTVINVDPAESAVMGWPLDLATFSQLNQAFHTNVELRDCFLEDANLDSDSVDRIFCISTLEHVPAAGIARILSEARRILRPGGMFVLTVDLFLDLTPFSDVETSPAGHNVNIRRLVEQSELALVQGDRSELLGYPEFEPRRILSRLTSYSYGARNPALAQAFVLQKPD